MATRRYAHALVSKQDIEFDQWVEEIRSQHEGLSPKGHVARVANTVLRKADPKQFLLSHATIVASVDTYAPRGAKTGRMSNRGVQIEVRNTDYRIKPEGFEIINNNGDAWERSLLLSTYRTFIGAPNYLEHIQLPELSKGLIIDAISRDLGKTCYIDILVGTNRKHSKLVADILSGEMNALSMGCISLFTTCTKCGNVAVDDAQLCPCIMYEGKGNFFADEDGVQHPIAELIGHVSVPNSNQFIEASWVKNPAFRGAVRRNFLNADTIAIASKLGEAAKTYEVRASVSVPGDIMKAASVTKKAQGQDLADIGQGQGTDAGGQESGSSDAAQGGDQGQPADQSGGQGQADPGTDSGMDSGGSFGGGSSGGGSSDGSSGDELDAGGQEQSEDVVDSMIDQANDLLLKNLLKSLKQRLEPKAEDVKAVAPSASDWESTSGNDNLVRSSIEFGRRLRKTFTSTKLIEWAEKTYKIVHIGGKKSIQANGITAKDLIVLSWIEDRVNGHRHPSNLYKAAMHAGSPTSYPSTKSYVAACEMKLGRVATEEERKFFSMKGRVASVVEF